MEGDAATKGATVAKECQAALTADKNLISVN